MAKKKKANKKKAKKKKAKKKKAKKKKAKNKSAGSLTGRLAKALPKAPGRVIELLVAEEELGRRLLKEHGSKGQLGVVTRLAKWIKSTEDLEAVIDLLGELEKLPAVRRPTRRLGRIGKVIEATRAVEVCQFVRTALKTDRDCFRAGWEDGLPHALKVIGPRVPKRYEYVARLLSSADLFMYVPTSARARTKSDAEWLVREVNALQRASLKLPGQHTGGRYMIYAVTGRAGHLAADLKDLIWLLRTTCAIVRKIPYKSVSTWLGWDHEHDFSRLDKQVKAAKCMKDLVQHYGSRKRPGPK